VNLFPFLSTNHSARFSAEIQDIFKGTIFAQLMAAAIVICMTCFLMVNQDDYVAQFASLMYLGAMVFQLLLFCSSFAGQEMS